jgi:hypothetical protein
VAFLYETPFLNLEIYRLRTILEASSALAKFEESETDENKVEFLRGLEFPEISRIVVSLAAIIRSAIDTDPRAYAASYPTALRRAVGTLILDETHSQTREPLPFREACNKVIHANTVEPTRELETGALTGELVLCGCHRNKDWRAELDLREYALSALSLTP